MFTHRKMYFLLVLFIFVAYTQQQLLDPTYMAKWNKAREDCATEEAMDLAVAKKAWDENKFPDDNKLKCFYKCVNLKMGIIDTAGEVVDEELGNLAVQISDRATKEEIVAECGPLKGADLCETSYKLTACIKAAILD